jgi:hypothetical protein
MTRSIQNLPFSGGPVSYLSFLLFLVHRMSRVRAGGMAFVVTALASPHERPDVRRETILSADSTGAAIEPSPAANNDKYHSASSIVSSDRLFVWRADTEVDGSSWRARLYDATADSRLSWADAIDALINGRLGVTLTAALRASPHAAGTYYLEMPPLSTASANVTAFELRTLDAPNLSSGADTRPFAEQLAGCARKPAARAFANLGGDATLVVPCHAAGVPVDTYASIAPFLREAPAEQLDALWIALGVQLHKALHERADAPIWVSTEGLGVAWLHVRLDSSPKYFHYDGYVASPSRAGPDCVPSAEWICD